MDAIDFRPARFLEKIEAAAQEQEHHCRSKPALLILNQPVSSLAVLQRLWAHTTYRLCADGGANRLYETFNREPDAARCREQFLPSIIHGDLDSLRDDVRDYYASKGVAVSRDPDQYSTDFGKAIKQIIAATTTPSPSSSAASTTTSPSYRREILILCTLAGRVDQGLGLLYEMLRIQNAYRDARLWLFSESSVSFILPPGEHRIAIPAGFFTENVGILPAFGPATISTKGLEWDVTDWLTSVEGNVSTSNHAKRDVVMIRTDRKVLFTIERAEELP